MLITWDEHKRQPNVNKHGFDFADLSDEFFANSVIVPPMAVDQWQLADCGMARLLSFRPPGAETISIVSMRVANRKERKVLE